MFPLLLPGFVLPWAASPCMTQSFSVDRTCSLSLSLSIYLASVCHMKRDTAGLSLLYRVCLPVALPDLLSPPPTLFNRSMPFPTAREFLAMVRLTSFIVCYCPAVLCSRRDRHCMTMMVEGEVENGAVGGGGERDSRDRPRCPVLHCRSAVRRRPAHCRHHCRHHVCVCVCVCVARNRGRTRQKLLSVRPSFVPHSLC